MFFYIRDALFLKKVFAFRLPQDLRARILKRNIRKKGSERTQILQKS